jgi:hypothetical protein
VGYGQGVFEFADLLAVSPLELGELGSEVAIPSNRRDLV